MSLLSFDSATEEASSCHRSNNGSMARLHAHVVPAGENSEADSFRPLTDGEGEHEPIDGDEKFHACLQEAVATREADGKSILRRMVASLPPMERDNTISFPTGADSPPAARTRRERMGNTRSMIEEEIAVSPVETKQDSPFAAEKDKRLDGEIGKEKFPIRNLLNPRKDESMTFDCVRRSTVEDVPGPGPDTNGVHKGDPDGASSHEAQSNGRPATNKNGVPLTRLLYSGPAESETADLEQPLLHEHSFPILDNDQPADTDPSEPRSKPFASSTEMIHSSPGSMMATWSALHERIDFIRDKLRRRLLDFQLNQPHRLSTLQTLCRRLAETSEELRVEAVGEQEEEEELCTVAESVAGRNHETGGAVEFQEKSEIRNDRADGIGEMIKQADGLAQAASLHAGLQHEDAMYFAAHKTLCHRLDSIHGSRLKHPQRNDSSTIFFRNDLPMYENLHDLVWNGNTTILNLAKVRLQHIVQTHRNQRIDDDFRAAKLNWGISGICDVVDDEDGARVVVWESESQLEEEKEMVEEDGEEIVQEVWGSLDYVEEDDPIEFDLLAFLYSGLACLFSLPGGDNLVAPTIVLSEVVYLLGAIAVYWTNFSVGKMNCDRDGDDITTVENGQPQRDVPLADDEHVSTADRAQRYRMYERDTSMAELRTDIISTDERRLVDFSRRPHKRRSWTHATPRRIHPRVFIWNSSVLRQLEPFAPPGTERDIGSLENLAPAEDRSEDISPSRTVGDVPTSGHLASSGTPPLTKRRREVSNDDGAPIEHPSPTKKSRE